MKNNKATAQTPQDLLNELRTLVSEAEKMLGESISEKTDEAVGALRHRYEDVQERMSELYEGARKKVVAGAKKTDEAIRDNPYQSLAIAAGVALVVGILLGRNSKQ